MELRERTVVRVRLLHKRNKTARRAATKTRQPRTIPATAPPERGTRETKEVVVVGREREEDVVRINVALTSAVYSFLYKVRFSSLEASEMSEMR